MRWFDDPLDGLSIARGVRVIAWGVAVTFLVVSLATSLVYAPFYPRAYTGAAVALLGVPLAFGVRSLRTPSGPLRELQAYVVLSCLLQLADPFVATLPPGSVDYPPLNHALAAGRIAAGVVLLPRTGVPLVLVSTIALAVERSWSVGTPQSIGEWAIFIVAGLAPFVLMWAIRGELERLRASTAASLDAQSRARVAAQRTLVHQRLDGLIHDKVLAALNLASRGRATDAAGLAEEAIVHLTPGRAGGEASVAAKDVPAQIVAHATALGLDLSFLSMAWPSGAPGDALRSAACEALTNVAKHAGTKAASVQGVERDGVFLVEIRDHGRGFDPAAVRPGRLGVRDRIVSTMESVGGAARIESSRGAGTRVVLTWTRPPLPEADSQWLPRVLRLLLPLVGVSLAGYVAIGALHLSESLSPEVSMAGLVAVPLLTALVGTLRIDGRLWRPTLVAIVVVWAALLINVDRPDAADWRTWFIGGFNWAVGLIAARKGGRTAVWVAAWATGIGMVGYLARGDWSFLPVAAASVQVFGWAIGIGWLKAIADGSASRTAALLHERQLAEAQAAEADALDAEIAARQQGLDAGVLPLMRSIASGLPLSDAERRRCIAVEASTRDQLVARTLLTPELTTAIADARARGCRVTILGRAAPGDPTDAFRQAALSLVLAGQPGDRLTLRWAPDETGTLATCVLIGGDAVTRDLGAAALLPSSDITVDADSVLVRLLAPA